MKNSGKWLENLVSTIEESVLPSGFKVETREKISNDEGVQIAEFDIIISGKLGTTEINWLIECRDRPSEGSAEGAWIEQLGGRKTIYGFNKVTAVSTTGFSPGAIQAAETLDIELRTVEQLTAETVLDWLKLDSMSIIIQNGDLSKAVLEFGEEILPEELKEYEALLKKAGVKEKIFVNTASGDPVSIIDAWQDVINNNQSIFSGLTPESPLKRQVIEASYTNPKSRYSLITSQGEIAIIHITFIGELSVKETQLPIAKMLEYSGLDDQKISQTIQF